MSRLQKLVEERTALPGVETTPYDEEGVAALKGARVHDKGAEIGISIKGEQLWDWADRWPGISDVPDQGLFLSFSKRNGDLIDMDPADTAGDWVGPLSQDALEYAKRKLGLSKKGEDSDYGLGDPLVASKDKEEAGPRMGSGGVDHSTSEEATEEMVSINPVMQVMQKLSPEERKKLLGLDPNKEQDKKEIERIAKQSTKENTVNSRLSKIVESYGDADEETLPEEAVGLADKGHTNVERGEDGYTTVTLHQTDVVKFNDDEIILDSGGWNTPTTKSRINQASTEFDLGISVYQKKGSWYVVTPDGEKPFEDGMSIPRK